jgi:glucose/arabinose dehydrogenase
MPAAGLGTASEAAEAANPIEAVNRGKTVFQQSCSLCHETGQGAKAGLGPNLAGLLGRRAGSTTNFNYSKPLIESQLVWNVTNLDRFLLNPTALVPGTSMLDSNLSTEKRRDLIAFLSTLTGPWIVSQTNQSEPRSTASSAETDTGAWRTAAPGVQHHLMVAALPPPFSTSSAGNGPRVVQAPEGATLSVPAGFTVRQFATGLARPRLLRVAPGGDIFIAETSANRIRVLRGADGADAPTENQIFANGLNQPFGIAFYPAESPQWVYVANNNSVVRFPYQAGDLTARGPAQTILPRLCQGTGGHTTRDVAFSRDGKRMFVSVGSGSNVAEGMSRKDSGAIRAWEAEHGQGAAWDSETGRADVLVTDPEGREPMRAFATGIRNGVGLAVNPDTGELWVSTNERDGLGDNLVPDYITRVKEGGYYGWPWYYMGNLEDPRHSGERPDLAGKAIVPDVLLQAHSASLEMVFYEATNGVAAFPAEYRGDIFAAFHGSWNRNERTGYKVVRVRVTHGVPTGVYEDFLTGFVVNNRDVWGRPVGVAVAHDGALLVTEDGNGTLWRVASRPPTLK